MEIPESSKPELTASPNDDDELRLTWALQKYHEIFDPGRSSAAVEYFQNGGSLRLLLQEIIESSPPTAATQHLNGLRSAYIESLFEKAKPLKRSSRAALDEASDWLQAEYVEGVVGKIAAVIDAQTPEEALEVRQMPLLVKEASFIEGKALSEEEFAGNHLYVLIDTALKEHVLRREIIEAHQHRTRVARLLGNRLLLATLAGGVIALSLIPKFGIIPNRDDVFNSDIELGLRGLSVAVLVVDLPEIARLKYLDFKHDKRTDKLHKELSKEDLSDLSLKMVSGSSRYNCYGSGDTPNDWSGSADAAENLKKFKGLDLKFEHFNNDPEGKPYSGDQALGYAARLLLERRDQIREIIDPLKPAAEQKALYLELCRDILTEDVRRMKKGLNVSLPRRIAMGAVLLPTVIMPEAAVLSDAATLGQSVAQLLKPKKDKTPDD